MNLKLYHISYTEDILQGIQQNVPLNIYGKISPHGMSTFSILPKHVYKKKIYKYENFKFYFKESLKPHGYTITESTTIDNTKYYLWHVTYIDIVLEFIKL